MKIKEVIQKLQDVQRAYGEELEVLLSSDTEGNSFGSIDTTSFVMCRPGEDAFCHTASVCGWAGDRAEREIDRFMKVVKPNAVCIYPFHEDFNSPEEVVGYLAGQVKKDD